MQETTETHAATRTQHKDYPSNPIQTAKTGLSSFWQNGKQALPGVTIVGVVLIVIAIISALTAIVATLLIVLFNVFSANPQLGNQVFESLAAGLPPETIEIADSLASSSAAITVVIAAAIIALFCGTLLQAITYAYVGITVVNKQVGQFSGIMRLAFKRMMPLLAQTALLFVVAAILLVTPLLLLAPAIPKADSTNGLALGIALYYLLFIIAAIMIGLRIAFAQLAVVASGLGPIESLKHSLRITKGRVWEVIGVLSIMAIIFGVIELLFTPIRVATSDLQNTALFWFLIELTVSTIATYFSIAILAHRFVQLRTISESSTHNVSYKTNIAAAGVAVLMSIIIGSIQSAMSPPAPNLIDPYSPNLDSLNYEDPAPSDDSLYDYDFETVPLPEGSDPYLDSAPDDTQYYYR